MVRIILALAFIVLASLSLGTEAQERDPACYDQYAVVLPRCPKKTAKYRYEFETNSCERKVHCYKRNEYTFYDSKQACMNACVRVGQPIPGSRSIRV